jgi:hypothetical protein
MAAPVTTHATAIQAGASIGSPSVGTARHGSTANRTSPNPAQKTGITWRSAHFDNSA